MENQYKASFLCKADMYKVLFDSKEDPLCMLKDAECLEFIKTYIQYMTCIIFGEKKEYVQFLEMNSQQGNVEAKALLNSEILWRNVNVYLRKQISLLNDAGHKRISLLCEAVRTYQKTPPMACSCWSVCALSGMATSESILIELSENTSVNVGMNFSPFFQGLWLISNLERLENERIQLHLTLRQDESIKESILQFNGSNLSISSGEIETYKNAMCFVLETFKVTIANIVS